MDATAKVTTRNQSLDVLRGIAILLVLGRHHPYYALWHRAGWIGVDLFFVLSGFLISGLLFSEYKKTGAIDFKRFLVRRGFKIYPAYYAFLLLTLPVTFHSLHLADLSFMQAYFPRFLRHTWSLSVEEHFYIALPLLLLLSLKLFPRSGFRWIPYVATAILILCLVLRFGLGSGIYEVIATHLRCDALFAGVMLGWLYHFHHERFSILKSHWLLAVGILLGSGAFWIDLSSYWMYTLGFTANILGFSCLLLWAVNTKLLARFQPLAWIGFYSYSIYLWHYPVAKVFEAFLPSSFIGFWTYVSVAILTGIGMAKLIEVPMLTLRDRLFPSSGTKQFNRPAPVHSQAVLEPCQ